MKLLLKVLLLPLVLLTGFLFAMLGALCWLTRRPDEEQEYREATREVYVSQDDGYSENERPGREPHKTLRDMSPQHASEVISRWYADQERRMRREPLQNVAVMRRPRTREA